MWPTCRVDIVLKLCLQHHLGWVIKCWCLKATVWSVPAFELSCAECLEFRWHLGCCFHVEDSPTSNTLNHYSVHPQSSLALRDDQPEQKLGMSSLGLLNPDDASTAGLSQHWKLSNATFLSMTKTKGDHGYAFDLRHMKLNATSFTHVDTHWDLFNSPLLFWIPPWRFFEFIPAILNSAAKIFWMSPEFCHGDLNLPLLLWIPLRRFCECPLPLPFILNSAVEIF